METWHPFEKGKAGMINFSLCLEEEVWLFLYPGSDYVGSQGRASADTWEKLTLHPM